MRIKTKQNGFTIFGESQYKEVSDGHHPWKTSPAEIISIEYDDIAATFKQVIGYEDGVDKDWNDIRVEILIENYQPQMHSPDNLAIHFSFLLFLLQLVFLSPNFFIITFLVRVKYLM